MYNTGSKQLCRCRQSPEGKLAAYSLNVLGIYTPPHLYRLHFLTYLSSRRLLSDNKQHLILCFVRSCQKPTLADATFCIILAQPQEAWLIVTMAIK